MVGAGSVDDSTLRLIPAAPLIVALVIGVAIAIVRRRISRAIVVLVSTAAAFAPLVLSGVAFSRLVFVPEDVDPPPPPFVLVDTLYSWVGAGVGRSAFTADLGFRFDALTAVVCLVLASVGLLVHVHSIGWLARDRREDGGVARYFCYLALLGTSSLVLVLADNLLLLFLGWQGVGVASYLFTVFWYGDDANARVGGRAFVVDRIGDAGFAVGTLALFWAMADAGAPAVSFRGLEASFDLIAASTVALPAWTGLGDVALPSAIGAAFLVAVVGKAAQLPLHVARPEAAVGPVPAIAAVHLAQVVAAVYLVVRLSFLFSAAPGASVAMAVVGAATAVLSASLACAATDVRKIASHAAVSQAGLMLFAVGAGAYRIAVFHLTLHAFFMTLFFLGVGSLVAALGGEVDLARMGGLRPRLKRTWWAVAIGVLTFAAVPPLSAFLSVGEIHAAVLYSTLPGVPLLYGAALASAVLSAFLGARLVLRAFHGPERVRRRRAEIREAGDLMLWPVWVLAAFSVIGGLVGLPQVFGDMMGVDGSDSLGNFLARVLPAEAPVPASELASALGATIACTALGLGVAYLLYASRPALGERLQRSWVRTLVARGYFLPDVYAFLFGRGLSWLSLRALHRGVEVGAIERGLSDGARATVRGLAIHGLRYLQSGLVQPYLIVGAVGAAVALLWVVGGSR